MRPAAARQDRGRTVVPDADPYGAGCRLPAGSASVTHEQQGHQEHQEHHGGPRGWSAARRGVWSRLRFTSLRLRLVVVFGLVALTAAVSASGIAYWLNREAVLTRAQDAVLGDFEQEMQNRAGALPGHPTQDELQHTAGQMANSSQRFSVLLIAENPQGRTVYGSSGGLSGFSVQDVPVSLREAVNERQKVTSTNKYAYHLYWQRITEGGTPYLVAGTRTIGGGPTGYMLKSLEPEAKDLNSLAWSLGIATGLALIGSALLAQALATTVLKPVQRLGVAARRLGEGRLDTRLRVSGTDELADLSRTFNKAAEALEKRVADMAARDDASRRFVADMSHELRTPLTAITAVTEVLEEELEFEGGGIDPMIEPAVRLVVSETRRLNDLVENLMEVTRFDAGTARLVLDDVDIADQITACIDARAWLDAVELDAERGIHARIDPRRLDVILANLIGNALKHGGSPVRVSVREERADGSGSGGDRSGGTDVAGAGGADAVDGTGTADEADSGTGTEDGGTMVIEVRDQGPGIPEDVLPHVFDRFYKASASRPRSEGSGLGLSIAMENAHAHGGEITAANAPGGGAVFTLRLPRDVSALTEQDAGDARASTGGASGKACGGRGGTRRESAEGDA
ncbi:ATP-binding protein [Streptomyces sp. NPDC058632]|uniref:ATP-binding protein n=1 Tax=unclassified Streptomyces TaxID=2593676 RepID=UPI003653AC81